MTELHEAASLGDLERVEDALRRGLNPNETDPEWSDRTPLHIAASKGYIHHSKHVFLPPSRLLQACKTRYEVLTFLSRTADSKSVFMYCYKLELTVMLLLAMAGHQHTMLVKLGRY